MESTIEKQMESMSMLMQEIPPARRRKILAFVNGLLHQVEEKEERCAELEKRLGEEEKERAILENKLLTVLAEFERLEKSEEVLSERFEIVREERDAMEKQIWQTLQTPPPPAMRDAATEPAEATPEPTRKTYAEVAVQVSATARAKRRVQKASEVVRVPKPQPKQQRGRDTTTGSSTSENPSAQARTCRLTSPGGEGGFEPTPTRAVVIHGVPTKYKPGQMRRWIQEDNPTGAPKIIGIRWLLQDHRRVGKLASSLVVYLDESVIVNKGLRMGRRIFRTTNYDWDR